MHFLSLATHYMENLSSPTKNSMENLSQEKVLSGDNFSFPTIEKKIQDSEFEFGSVTEPTSPKSPADHLFYNGRLLPHLFPVQNPNTITRSTSRASTISSKDSLISSRSSSTISRTNSCGSSARTSISADGFDQRRVFLKNVKPKTVLVQQYGGSSQQWQFMAPAPVMKQRLKRKNNENLVKKEMKGKIKGECFCWRILKWFVWVCQKCHALEPPVREDGLPRSLELV